MRAIFAAPAAVLAAAVYLIFGPPAHASCPEGQQEDPATRTCLSQSGQGASYYPSSAGPCIPDQVGNCVGRLRANPLQDVGPQTYAGPPNPAEAGQNAWLPSSKDKGGKG